MVGRREPVDRVAEDDSRAIDGQIFDEVGAADELFRLELADFVVVAVLLAVGAGLLPHLIRSIMFSKGGRP